jgi:RNA polymerase sigma factor (sigma-70 family)
VNVARNGRRAPLTVAVRYEEPVADASAASVAPAELTAAISALSERQRLVLFLRYYADLDYATIAEALSISSGTVGATLTTARAALGHALEVKEATP